MSPFTNVEGVFYGLRHEIRYFKQNGKNQLFIERITERMTVCSYKFAYLEK